MVLVTAIIIIKFKWTIAKTKQRWSVSEKESSKKHNDNAVLALCSCQSGPPHHIPSDEFREIFKEDPRNSFQSFIPSREELDKFETSLKKYLEELTASNKGYKRNVLDEVHPLEYSLGWFKRRYFGRIDNKGNRKIFVELVGVRCGGPRKWKQIEFPSQSNFGCWWSVEYDIQKNEIEKLKYP